MIASVRPHGAGSQALLGRVQYGARFAVTAGDLTVEIVAERRNANRTVAKLTSGFYVTADSRPTSLPVVAFVVLNRQDHLAVVGLTGAHPRTASATVLMRDREDLAVDRAFHDDDGTAAR